MSRDRLLTAGLLLTLLACGGDPTEPPPSDGSPSASPLAIGDTVLRELGTADTVVRYTIRPGSASEIALFIQADQGVAFAIMDSVTNQLLTLDFVPADSAPDHLMFHWTGRLQTSPGQVLLVELRTASVFLPSRIQLLAIPVNPEPEDLPVGLAVDDTLRGETLANPADVDEFTLEASAGDELIAFIRGSDGLIPGGLRLEVTGPAGDPLASVNTALTDVELEASSSRVFVAPVSGTYRVSIWQSAPNASDDHPGTGTYSALIRQVHRSPETAPVTLAPGDTLENERIDFVGDVDEFTVPVVADSVYNVFLQTLASDDQPKLRAFVLGAGEVPAAFSAAGDTALAEHFTGDFVASATGSITVRVVAADELPGLHRGRYRLFVYLVNGAPETAPGTITPGDSVAEAIDFPGDIDWFVVSHPATDRLNLVLRRPNTQSDQLAMRWTAGEDTTSLLCLRGEGEGESACGSGRLNAASAVSVEVAGASADIPAFRGPYRLVTLPIDSAPEGRPAAIALGDPVTEAIDPLGDEDVYLLSAAGGTQLEIEGTGGSGISTDGFYITLEDPDGNPMPGYAWALPTLAAQFSLPADGTYHVRVGGASSGQESTESGAYSFTINVAPAAAAALAAPGR